MSDIILTEGELLHIFAFTCPACHASHTIEVPQGLNDNVPMAITVKMIPEHTLTSKGHSLWVFKCPQNYYTYDLTDQIIVLEPQSSPTMMVEQITELKITRDNLLAENNKAQAELQKLNDTIAVLRDNTRILD
jgi:hypothetical protein